MQAVWIELPVHNLERAMAFYQAVFKLEPTEILVDDTRRTTTLVDSTNEGRPGISLNHTANFTSSDHGPLVYIDASDDVAGCLERIESAGGTIAEAKTSMGKFGYYATFLDTEGNMLALYSYS